MVAKMAIKQAPKVIKMVTKRRKRKARAGVSMDPYMTMIADPCNAELVPGMYGSNQGMLARFKASFAFSEYQAAWGAYKYGYILWYPTFHNATTTSGHANLFFFGSSSPAVTPTLLNYGVFGNSTSASSATDPAYNFVSGDVCQDARTLSACIVSTYTGTTSDAQGLYIPITNFPLTAALSGGTGNAPATVDQLRNYATMQERAATTDEVVWRPSVSSTFYPFSTEGVLVSNGSNSTIPSSSVVANPVGIALVYYNVSALSDYTVTCYKNIEWRAEPTSGLTMQPPKGVDNPARISKALNTLDNKKPFWQTKFGHTTATILRDVVLGGMTAAPLLL